MFVWSRLSSAPWADAWEERFAGHGGAVISHIPGRKTVRVEVYCDRKPEARAIQRQFGGTIRILRARNWAALRPRLPLPLRVRDVLLISASSDRKVLQRLARSHPGRSVLGIPPEMAFGTGHHATTATVLRLLADFARSRRGHPWSLCDLGTGSGVLAIAASKLGATDIRACDFDPHAVRVARDNVRRNRARGVAIVEADARKWSPGLRFDCIAANLFSDVLVAAFPKMARLLKPDGRLLVSGILKSQAAECLRAGEAAGFRFDRMITKGKWVTARGAPEGTKSIRAKS